MPNNNFVDITRAPSREPIGWHGHRIWVFYPQTLQFDDGAVLTYGGSGDADPEYVSIWDCSCGEEIPCKHVDAYYASQEGEMESAAGV